MDFEGFLTVNREILIRLRGYKIFSCSTLLRMKYSLLINNFYIYEQEKIAF